MKLPVVKASGVLNFEGPPTQSIFYHIQKWCLQADSQSKLQKIIQETMEYVTTLNNDRLLVLVGALLVENAVDNFFSAIIPDYKSVREKRDFTFSIAIELARTLRLCPFHLFACADNIRDIRNRFVHNLSIDSFTNLPSGKSQSMRDHLSKINPNEGRGKSDAEVFTMLVNYITMGLWLYSEHVIWLNKFIRSEQFLSELKKYCMARGGGVF